MTAAGRDRRARSAVLGGSPSLSIGLPCRDRMGESARRRLISCVRSGPAEPRPGGDEPCRQLIPGRLFLACEHQPRLACVKLVPSRRALTGATAAGALACPTARRAARNWQLRGRPAQQSHAGPATGSRSPGQLTTLWQAVPRGRLFCRTPGLGRVPRRAGLPDWLAQGWGGYARSMSSLPGAAGWGPGVVDGSRCLWRVSWTRWAAGAPMRW